MKLAFLQNTLLFAIIYYNNLLFLRCFKHKKQKSHVNDAASNFALITISLHKQGVGQKPSRGLMGLLVKG